MRLTLAKLGVGLAWPMGLISGCGTDPVAPPPPIAVPETAKTIFMITPFPPEADPEGWVIVGQREANREGVIFRSLGPGPQETSAVGPEMVRRAIGDGASAIIVVSSETPGLPESLAEAESKRIPVVVIGRPISAPSGSPPFTTVGTGSFDTSAERLVAAALGDAKKAGLPADGTAVILVPRDGDSFSVDRTDALKSACTKAGLKVLVLEFDPPPQSPTAAEAVRKILGVADVTILLAVDETAMQLSMQARSRLAPRRKVFMAGYVGGSSKTVNGVYGSGAAFVEFRSEDLGRLAVQAALARLLGEPPGRKVELDQKFRRSLVLDSVGSEGYEPNLIDPSRSKSSEEPRKTAQ